MMSKENQEQEQDHIAFLFFFSSVSSFLKNFTLL